MEITTIPSISAMICSICFLLRFSFVCLFVCLFCLLLVVFKSKVGCVLALVVDLEGLGVAMELSILSGFLASQMS